MDKNHPAYEPFQKWASDNGIDPDVDGIDLSVFWSCWITAWEDRQEELDRIESDAEDRRWY